MLLVSDLTLAQPLALLQGWPWGFQLVSCLPWLYDMRHVKKKDASEKSSFLWITGCVRFQGFSACKQLALALGSFSSPDNHDDSDWSPFELRASLWRLSQYV